MRRHTRQDIAYVALKSAQRQYLRATFVNSHNVTTHDKDGGPTFGDARRLSGKGWFAGMFLRPGRPPSVNPAAELSFRSAATVSGNE